MSLSSRKHGFHGVRTLVRIRWCLLLGGLGVIFGSLFVSVGTALAEEPEGDEDSGDDETDGDSDANEAPKTEEEPNEEQAAEEIWLHAERDPRLLASGAAPVLEIDRATISETGGSNLADVLERAPGLSLVCPASSKFENSRSYCGFGTTPSPTCWASSRPCCATMRPR